MDSDPDIRPEPDSSWGAVLKEIHKKMTSSDLLEDLDLDYVCGTMGSADFEGNWKADKALINKKVPVEIRKPCSSRRTSIIDVNFNMEAGNAGGETSVQPEERRVRRHRRKRRSKKENAAENVQDHSNNDTPHLSDAATPKTLTSGATTPDFCSDIIRPGANQLNQELTLKLQQLMGQGDISDSSTNQQNSEHDGEHNGDYMDVDEGEFAQSEDAELDDEAKAKLFKLVAQSRLMYLSSTDDDVDKAGVSEEEEDAQQSGDLKFTLCRLEQQVKSTQFSSTEDELDRIGQDEEQQQDEHQEELAVRVCKLASRVNASQFSSTEAELDRAGQDEIVQNDRRESIGELDVNMFELREDLTTGNYLEMSKAGDLQVGEETEGLDFDRRESIRDFDVSMFELKDKEMNSWSWEGSVEQDALGGANFMENKTTSVGSEISLQESKSREGDFGEEMLGAKQDGDMSVSDSEEDEAEFNRIINSMLTLTLEDMHGGGQNVGEMHEEVQPAGNGGAMRAGEDGETGEKCNQSVGDDVGNESPGTRTDGLKDGKGPSEEELKLGMNTADDTVETLDDAETQAQIMDKGESSNVGLESNQEQSRNPQTPEGLLSPEEIQKRNSAESLRSITTEVLKVLNATEQLLLDTQGQDAPSAPCPPLSPDHRHLDQQLCRLEENVYMAAGSVYSLEAELDDLEECSRAVSSSTSHSELCFLEEQVATAAAEVQQSEIQISDISARIAALRSAGLNVEPPPTFTKSRTAKSMTLDGSRQQRRLLPAPPTKGESHAEQHRLFNVDYTQKSHSQILEE
uniref:Rab effector MyRIP/Melanophilin domain-containing protein n=1 Tax=Neogobius melanostomus TaxID=47308 RepID=A0A8C6TCA5_9GOBI